VLAKKPTDDGTINALMHALRHLGRCQCAAPFTCGPWLKQLDAVSDLVKLFEDAFKQQPDNDELGRQAFFANVRAGNWKAAQLVRFIYTLITGSATASFRSYRFTCAISLWNSYPELIRLS
jgi:hypothetical protein